METIVATTEGRVRILRLNRPEVRNALNLELRAALERELDLARGDDAVRAVILTGAGSAFCSGLDLKDLETLTGGATSDNRADSEELARLFSSVYRFPKPVVAAVNGPAVGGGAGLASVCDVIVMSEAAKIGYSEVRVGFVPALVAVFLVRQIGDRSARDLLLSARMLTAAEARDVGLVNETAPPEAVLKRALARAGEMTRNAPAAIALTKTLLSAVGGLGVEEGLRYAQEINALARTTDDLKEGIRSFLDKRPPSWQREA